MSDNKVVPFLVSTTLGGLLLLVPLALLGFVIYIAYDILVQVRQATGLDLPFSDAVDGLIIGVGAMLAVLILCFAIGLILRTNNQFYILDQL